MRTLLLGVVVFLSGLPLGCSDDAQNRGTDDSRGGQSSGANAAVGGQNDTEHETGGDRGVGGNATDDATARSELCQTVCTTEAELSCPPDREACLKGWCTDPTLYYPLCPERYDTMLRCMADQPVEAFECSEGMAYPKEETCAEEQAALVPCVED